MTDNHFDRTTRICKHLNIENLGEHHGVLLADAFEDFIYRGMCLNHYGLDPLASLLYRTMLGVLNKNRS